MFVVMFVAGTHPALLGLLSLAGLGGILFVATHMSERMGRLAAFICSGTMAVAYFMVHAPNGFFPILNKGELAVFYCWLFFFVVFYGPGSWSIDALVGKRKSAAATT